MGAVAICISRQNDSIMDNALFPSTNGHAFCFLPLPVSTHLPVHVNAYFELSSNRRDIWRADDTTGESRIRGQWNQTLITDVIAPMYAELLSKATAYVKQRIISMTNASVDDKQEVASSILSLLPCSEQLQFPWKLLTTSVLPLLQNSEVPFVIVNSTAHQLIV
jgi:hypothetical protein